MSNDARPAAIVDVDGTLIDSNYHHAMAWHHAFRDHDILVPVWRLHRLIGMGGDQFVEASAGTDVEERLGDALRDSHSEHYEPMKEEVRPLPGAEAFLRRLKERGHIVVLSSSAKEDEVERYVELLGGEENLDGQTTSADVEQTKPDPELIEVAHEKAGGGPAVMIGDSRWDCEAAVRAEIPCIGLLTGGFGKQELLDAGAKVVYETLDDLSESLERSPLAG